jgi:hypothetical protein
MLTQSGERGFATGGESGLANFRRPDGHSARFSDALAPVKNAVLAGA